MLEAVISAAEEMNSPVILGTAEVLLPYGSLELIAPSVISAAERAKVPVVVHFDHGTTVENCKKALSLGFSSIMFDGSMYPYEENVKLTSLMAEYAHNSGASIEGEIGHVGNNDSTDDIDRYTTVDEARQFSLDTGVDALAISIGTAHGVYKSEPKLDFNRLCEIRQSVDVPLVLHGGSGLSDSDFINCVKHGISKVNIFTDLCLAGERSVAKSTEEKIGYLEMRNAKVDAIKEAVKGKIRLFGSENKAK